MTTRECLHIPQKIQNVRAAVIISHPGAPYGVVGGGGWCWVPVPGVGGGVCPTQQTDTRLSGGTGCFRHAADRDVPTRPDPNDPTDTDLVGLVRSLRPDLLAV